MMRRKTKINQKNILIFLIGLIGVCVFTSCGENLLEPEWKPLEIRIYDHPGDVPPEYQDQIFYYQTRFAEWGLSVSNDPYDFYEKLDTLPGYYTYYCQSYDGLLKYYENMLSQMEVFTLFGQPSNFFRYINVDGIFLARRLKKIDYVGGYAMLKQGLICMDSPTQPSTDSTLIHESGHFLAMVGDFSDWPVIEYGLGKYVTMSEEWLEKGFVSGYATKPLESIPCCMEVVYGWSFDRDIARITGVEINNEYDKQDALEELGELYPLIGLEIEIVRREVEKAISM